MSDALVRAVGEGGVDEVVALLSSGVDPNARDSEGVLALRRASLRGNVGCVQECERIVADACSQQILVQGGARVDVLTKQGDSSLQLAMKHGAFECAVSLLEAGAKLSQLKKVAIHPQWFVAMIALRRRCNKSCLAFYGVLRKRWRLEDNQRVPRDMITLLTRMLWKSWRDERWQWDGEQPRETTKAGKNT